jgi:anthranilate phosphoribosyltransferase
MNTSLLTLIGLRAAALALASAGQQKSADTLYLLSDAIVAGRATDEHMASVAQLLASREVTDADMDDVMQRIATASDRLQQP